MGIITHCYLTIIPLGDRQTEGIALYKILAFAKIENFLALRNDQLVAMPYDWQSCFLGWWLFHGLLALLFLLCRGAIIALFDLSNLVYHGLVRAYTCGFSSCLCP
jgi:hypothetical protein